MRRRLRFPDSLILIFAMIVLAQVLTYVLPAGTFDREEVGGRERVVPGSYREIEVEPYTVPTFLKSLATPLTAIPKGMAEAGDIIFFVFLIGGAIGIVKATGALDGMIGAALRHLGGSPIILIAGMTALFAFGSASIGMAEEYMPFIPVLVTMSLALRMDAVVAVGIVYVGAGVGYGCAAWNPFTVVIAQDVAGLPVWSGQGFRWILLAVCLTVGVHHLLRYVSRIREDPSKSLVADVDYSSGFELPEDTALTKRRIAVLVAFALTIVLFVYGVAAWGWYLVELGAVFMGLAIVAAAVAGLTPNVAAREFCRGAGELTTAALLIGFARTIKVVLDDGQIIDTIIASIAGPLEAWGPSVAAVGMFGVQSICNLFIPSGSGQALVTMPIMAPLADLVGVGRQTAVLAYQMGDGFTNMIVPTNALLMGMLGLGRIPYQRWLRFIVPLLLKVYAVAIIALVVAVAIGY